MWGCGGSLWDGVVGVATGDVSALTGEGWVHATGGGRELHADVRHA